MKTLRSAMILGYVMLLGIGSLCVIFEAGGTALASENTRAPRSAPPEPRLMVMPLQPAEGHCYNGTGLAIQFLLGNVVALHPNLKELWFGWRIHRIFSEGRDFKGYCRGEGPPLDWVRLGREEDIRYWLYGRIQPQNGSLKVFLKLVDVIDKGAEHATALMLDPGDHLIGFRKGFLAWLDTCGLSMPQAQALKALWPEPTTLRALSLLGKGLESQYLHAIGKHEAPLDLKRFDQAVSAAPASYMALDLKAWVLFKNGDFEAAEGVFHSALKANPDGVGALSGLMWCAIRTDNEADAYAWAGAKAEITGESLAVAQASVASRMGNAAYNAENYEKAIEFYQKAITWNPSKRLYVTKLAGAYRRNTQFHEAIALIDGSLERFPEGQHRNALLLTKADSLIAFAAALRERGAYREAAERLERALAIDRIHRPKAAANDLEDLASIYDTLGDAARASEYRRRASEMERTHSSCFP
jgi:tetratricopeptide (TPR) repeat protein